MQINTNMREAPRTGKRILINTYMYKLNVVSLKYQKCGTAWRECYWCKNDGKWKEYCGVGQFSTALVDPIAWTLCPEDEG